MTKKLFLISLLVFIMACIICVAIITYLRFQKSLQHLQQNIVLLQDNTKSMFESFKLNQQRWTKDLASVTTAASARAESDMQLQTKTRLTAQGIFWHEDCVPAPQCPSDGASTPELYLFPLAINPQGSIPAITGFTAYAVGGFDMKSKPAKASKVSNCEGTQVKDCHQANYYLADQTYWRVCIDIKKPNQINPSQFKNQKPSDQSKYALGSVVALTQCK